MSDGRNDLKKQQIVKKPLIDDWLKHNCPSSFNHSDLDKKNVEATGAVKNDLGKTEWHHFPPSALEEIAKAFTFGGQKYGAYNFRAGFKYSRPFNAALRHLWAWWNGEEKDKDSNLNHLSHAACCIIMLLDFSQNKPELDDRYKKVDKP